MDVDPDPESLERPGGRVQAQERLGGLGADVASGDERDRGHERDHDDGRADDRPRGRLPGHA